MQTHSIKNSNNRQHTNAALHKRGQRQRVTGVLPPEDAEKKAVYHKQYAEPGSEGDALVSWIGHSGNLDGQRDAGEGEDTICI